MFEVEEKLKKRIILGIHRKSLLLRSVSNNKVVASTIIF